MGHPRQRLPELPAVQPRRRRHRERRRVQRFRASCARPATAARRGTSRAATSRRSSTRPAPARVLEDKQLMAVDNNVRSPFRDRIYVTWTEFAADGSAYIYESHSSNYGETFSPRVLVSSTSALCTQTFGVRDAERHLQREPVLRPVRRSGRLAVRRVGQLQQHRDRPGQPQPDAAGEVDRRRRDVQQPGQGQRLLRPARLPDLPG